jgi:glycosyltransferase involved in cell wall biosynthesis
MKDVSVVADEPIGPGVVSVIIPARNEAARILAVLNAVQRQSARCTDLEIILVDDGSTDETVALARSAGVKVLEMRAPGEGGNPAAARNRGARTSQGDPIVFLDADCVVTEGWLEALLSAHDRGATVVGGSLALPEGLPASARCDYYCGWYLVHPAVPAGRVPHHPPPNLSVRREAFLSTAGFSDQPPLDYTNEERLWQGELRAAGHHIYFEPRAVAYHFNRPGLGNLMRRNYRWGYTAVETKSRSGAARLAWLYRHPWFVILCSPLLALAHTGFILWCWTRSAIFEPLWMSPAILASRISYVTGMSVGAFRWMQAGRDGSNQRRERPRWQ